MSSWRIKERHKVLQQQQKKEWKKNQENAVPIYIRIHILASYKYVSRKFSQLKYSMHARYFDFSILSYIALDKIDSFALTRCDICAPPFQLPLPLPLPCLAHAIDTRRYDKKHARLKCIYVKWLCRHMNMSVQMSHILHGFHVQLRMLVIMLARNIWAQSNKNTYRKWRWNKWPSGKRSNRKRRKIKKIKNINKMPTMQTIYRPRSIRIELHGKKKSKKEITIQPIWTRNLYNIVEGYFNEDIKSFSK